MIFLLLFFTLQAQASETQWSPLLISPGFGSDTENYGFYDYGLGLEFQTHEVNRFKIAAKVGVPWRASHGAFTDISSNGTTARGEVLYGRKLFQFFTVIAGVAYQSYESEIFETRPNCKPTYEDHCGPDFSSGVASAKTIGAVFGWNIEMPASAPSFFGLNFSLPKNLLLVMNVFQIYAPVSTLSHSSTTFTNGNDDKVKKNETSFAKNIWIEYPRLTLGYLF